MCIYIYFDFDFEIPESILANFVLFQNTTEFTTIFPKISFPAFIAPAHPWPWLPDMHA